MHVQKLMTNRVRVLKQPGSSFMRAVVLIPCCALAGGTLAGCASSPPMPIAEYSRAQTLVQQAERNQAQQFAAADLTRAREKLNQAGKAMNSRDAKLADRYASEAALDAELALARSSAAQAGRSAAELRASIEELKAESRRNLTPP